MAYTLQPVDRVEIHTLQDNYIDLTSGDSSDMVRRAVPVRDGEIRNSILAEHGFSALVTVGDDDPGDILFDFGFSSHGAAFNADALGLDLSRIAYLVLSHGHMDHTGGLEALADRTGKKGMALIAHPVVFRHPRYIKPNEDLKLFFPAFTTERLDALGITPVLSKEPYPFMADRSIFLGEVPRESDFEKGMANVFFEADGEEKKDGIEDDSAIVFHLENKGLIIL